MHNSLCMKRLHLWLWLKNVYEIVFEKVMMRFNDLLLLKNCCEWSKLGVLWNTRFVLKEPVKFKNKSVTLILFGSELCHVLKNIARKHVRSEAVSETRGVVSRGLEGMETVIFWSCLLQLVQGRGDLFLARLHLLQGLYTSCEHWWAWCKFCWPRPTYPNRPP